MNARQTAGLHLLGRKLRQDEEVFYLDGDPRNCSPDNLVVLPRPSKSILSACKQCGEARKVPSQCVRRICLKCKMANAAKARKQREAELLFA